MDGEASTGLSRSLRRRHLFTLGVGTIIGVAWLMVLGSVLAGAGPLGAVIGFVVGAAFMIPIGLCYGELAAAFPHAGGEVVYAYMLFGTGWSYLAGICLAVIYVINCVFFAVSVGWLMNEVFPGIEGPALYSVMGTVVHWGDIAIGTVAALGLAAANASGARNTARLQDFATYALLLAGCVFIGVGLWRGEATNLRPLIAPSDWGLGYGGVLAALAVTPYFFGGFNTIPQAVAELEDPEDRRHVGGILALCIGASLAFYCLALLAVAHVLPRAQLLGFELPVAEAFRAAFHSRALTQLVLVGGVLGLIAVWNALFYAATRVLYALGRAHLLPTGLGRLSARTSVPLRAIVLVTLVSIAGLFLGKGVLLPVVNVTSTLFALMYALVSFGVLRHRRAAAPAGSYRVPGGTVLVWIAALFSLWLIALSLVQQRMDAHVAFPLEWLLLLVLAAVGALTWWRTGASRNAVTPAERRRVILEEGVG